MQLLFLYTFILLVSTNEIGYLDDTPSRKEETETPTTPSPETPKHKKRKKSKKRAKHHPAPESVPTKSPLKHGELAATEKTGVNNKRHLLAISKKAVSALSYSRQLRAGTILAGLEEGLQAARGGGITRGELSAYLSTGLKIIGSLETMVSAKGSQRKVAEQKNKIADLWKQVEILEKR